MFDDVKFNTAERRNMQKIGLLKMTDISFITDTITIYRKNDIKNADTIRYRYGNRVSKPGFLL